MYKSKFLLKHGATASNPARVSDHFLPLAVLICMLIAVVYKQPGSFRITLGFGNARQIQSIRGGVYDVGEEVDDDLVLLAQRQLDGRSETFPGNCKDFFQIVNAYTYSRSFQQWKRSKPRQLHYLIISVSTPEKTHHAHFYMRTETCDGEIRATMLAYAISKERSSIKSSLHGLAERATVPFRRNVPSRRLCRKEIWDARKRVKK